MSVSSGYADMPSLEFIPIYRTRSESDTDPDMPLLATPDSDLPAVESVTSSNSDTSVWTWGWRTSVPTDDLSDLDNETCTSCRTYGATVHSDLEASAGTAWARRAHSWPPCTFSRRGKDTPLPPPPPHPPPLPPTRRRKEQEQEQERERKREQELRSSGSSSPCTSSSPMLEPLRPRKPRRDRAGLGFR